MIYKDGMRHETHIHYQSISQGFWFEIKVEAFLNLTSAQNIPIFDGLNLLTQAIVLLKNKEEELNANPKS